MSRALGYLVLIYSLYCSILAFFAFIYLIGFVGNYVVPKTINAYEHEANIMAIVINISLIALFGLQHSLMAREWFKRFWKKIIPEYIERSTYLLISGFVVMLLIWQWKPITNQIWDIESIYIADIILTAIFWLGFFCTFTSIFAVNYLDFIGIRQAYCFFRGTEYKEPEISRKWLYKYIRNPLMLGLLMMFWSTAKMTLGHLIFSTGMTIYIFIGTYFEEKSLEKKYGDSYREYKKKVRMLIPIPKRTKPEFDVKEIRYDG